MPLRGLVQLRAEQFNRCCRWFREGEFRLSSVMWKSPCGFDVAKLRIHTRYFLERLPAIKYRCRQTSFRRSLCSSGRYMFHQHAQPGWLRSLSALQSLSHAFDCGESNDCWYDSLSRSSLFTIAFHELDLLQNGLVFNVSLIECAETN